MPGCKRVRDRTDSPNGKKKLKVEADEEEKSGDSSTSSDFCPICFQSFSFKTVLPDCKHEFCFLCIKGVSMRGGTCPLCRGSIDKRLFYKPTVEQQRPEATAQAECDNSKPSTSAKFSEENDRGRICWLYKSRGSGWWRFERRQEKELEEAFNSGAQTHELLIAGFIYLVDFKNMLQRRKDSLSSVPTEREVRRIVGEAEFNEVRSSILGVAGLPL